MKKLFCDLETRSAADLKKVGVDVYAHDPSTEILMMAYAFDDEPVALWQAQDGPMPDEIAAALTDPEIIKVAWNVGFEFALLSKTEQFDLKIDQWFDAMAYARYLGYPGHLEDACHALKLDDKLKKDGVGKKLIQKFSKLTRATKKKPAHFKNWETDPDDWKLFCDYCIQDVTAERAALNACKTKAVFPKSEKKIWLLDQEINERGIPIDLDYAGKSLALIENHRDEILWNIKALTGVENANAPGQLKTWLLGHNYNYDSLDKQAVADALAGNKISAQAREVLELKQTLGGVAFKKLPVIQQRTFENRLRGAFSYHSAHTGRWSSHGVQWHNLFKPTKIVQENNDAIVEAILAGVSMPADIHPIAAVSGTLRAVVRAEDGKSLYIADYSSIENRVLAWLSNCAAMLTVFKNKLDPYKSFAVKMYGLAYDEVTKEQRNFCKSPVLGCGFGMGWRRLIAYAATLGQKITEEEARELVAEWRKAYQEVVKYWYALGDVVVRAVKYKQQIQFGVLNIDGRNAAMLHIGLPSGRALHYDSPEIVKDMYGRPVLAYMGETMGGWGIIEARGSALVENVVQAIARDILANGMTLADGLGFDIILHCHDELVAEVPKDSGLSYEMFEECMTKNPSWGLTIPLAVEGFVSERYRK